MKTTAKFYARSSFALRSHNWFVIVGDIVEGTITRGMRILLPGKGVSLTTRVASVEFIDFIPERKAWVGLTVKYEHDEQLEMLIALEISGETLHLESPGLGAELVTLLSRRRGGRRGTGAAEELVRWANRAVDEGLDERAVCVLAGLTRPFHSSEVDEMLNAVLDALQLPEPTGQDELMDAELIFACDRALSGEMPPDDLLAVAAQIVCDSVHAHRFGRWIELIEDRSTLADGDGPYLVPGLTLENLSEHVLQAARSTRDELVRPPWLASYLALDARAGADPSAR